MAKKRLLVVVGTRPNFMKVSLFQKLLPQFPNLELKIAHTGQHYDSKMSGNFLDQLGISIDYQITEKATSNSHRMAMITEFISEIIHDYKPDFVVVPGDVDSTLAAAIAANKEKVQLAHIESGLRSFDKGMPEEINRILVDKITDVYLVSEPSGSANLVTEGVDTKKIHFVGNTMIDTLIHNSDKIDASEVLSELGVSKKGYVLMTTHRPKNVDFKEGLEKISKLITELSSTQKIVFPCHPRTLGNLEKYGMLSDLRMNDNLIFCDPLDYFSFQKLLKNASFVVTDSGGIQEETTYYKVKCYTLRPNTERPITITKGSNILIKDLSDIDTSSPVETFDYPDIKNWDGRASERILEIFDSI